MYTSRIVDHLTQPLRQNGRFPWSGFIVVCGPTAEV